MIQNKFRRYISHVGALTATLFVANCATYDIENLQHTPRTGHEFSKELANQYESLAKRDNDLSKEYNASYFAVKGQQAASGHDVLPEDPAVWRNVPEKMLPELMKKRIHLVSLLDMGGRWNLPKEAAGAQVGFDCMVSEMSSRSSCCDDNTAFCREMFETNIKILEKDLPSFVVLFEEDQFSLSNEAKRVLGYVADETRRRPDAKVTVKGYTDAMGGRRYNLVLSQNRANAVAQLLMQMGVEKKRIHSIGVGELSGPEVMPDNRKVVIHVH